MKGQICMACEKAKYVAHIREDGTEQTILEHLTGTANLAARFASGFDALEQGKLAGMLHDIGKYSKEFQNRILRNGPKVDHSTAGAYICALKNQNYSAFCIAGHHSGLPNLGGRDDDSERTLYARLKKAGKGMIPDYSAWNEEVAELPRAVLPEFVNENALSEFFFVRMLYSCLVDADFLDTEHFMKNGSVDREYQADMAVLKEKLYSFISDWYPPKGELNQKRCSILENCIDKHMLEQGVFTLTVPTGGGKTIASLAFAIKHAMAKGLKKIIYVIPYTSIIEQTADIFRKILGEDNVLEHHSNVNYEAEETTVEYSARMSLASENWDVPVVVTTAVQFFESLYSNKSSKCRKLHNIAESVVIFDEAQMIPLPYLKPCVYAISELTKNYKVTAVLCTATQPSLESVFKEFDNGFCAKELCPKELLLDQIFKRTRFEYAGNMSWSEVSEHILERKQILCIVNSRKAAKTVYELINGEGSYHLSTLMIPAERKRVLAEIRERLKNGEMCRVVATSLIEAGVDVDFPEVMREQAGLDSVLQAAGRCNREGRKTIESSVVTVFKSEEKVAPLFSANISACENVLKKYDDITRPECIMEYYNQLYYLKGENYLDKKGIINYIKNGNYPFKTVSDTFKMIDSDTYAVYIPLAKGKELVQRRKNGEMSKELFRTLGQYSVNIYREHLKSLLNAGDVEKVSESEWVLCNMSLYDKNMGISLEADSGKALFA